MGAAASEEGLSTSRPQEPVASHCLSRQADGTLARSDTRRNREDEALAAGRGAVFTAGDKVSYSDGREGIVVELDDEGDLNVRTPDGQIHSWYANRCKKVDGDLLATSFTLNLGNLPDIDIEEEAGVGDTVVYCDGTEAVITGVDGEGDLQVLKADGSTSTWYLDKCTNARKKVAIGEAVRYAGGDVAVIEEVDEDGDFTVRKKDGTTAGWYKSKTSGLEVAVSKHATRTNSPRQSEQSSQRGPLSMSELECQLESKLAFPKISRREVDMEGDETMIC